MYSLLEVFSKIPILHILSHQLLYFVVQRFLAGLTEVQADQDCRITVIHGQRRCYGLIFLYKCRAFCLHGGVLHHIVHVHCSFQNCVTCVYFVGVLLLCGLCLMQSKGPSATNSDNKPDKTFIFTVSCIDCFLLFFLNFCCFCCQIDKKPAFMRPSAIFARQRTDNRPAQNRQHRRFQNGK